MSDTDVNEYFRNKSFVVLTRDRKIDFDDIEKPVKTLIKPFTIYPRNVIYIDAK